MAEDKIYELENISIEILKTGTQRAQKLEKKYYLRILRLKRCNISILETLAREE